MSLSYLSKDEIKQAQEELKGRLHKLVDHAFEWYGPIETYYYDEGMDVLTIKLKMATPKQEKVVR